MQQVQRKLPLKMKMTKKTVGPGPNVASLGSRAQTEAPPLRSTVVRASARGAGGRGSIPDRVTPKTLKMGGLRFSAWRLALMS